MAYYYSASERAFFSSELMSTDAMPSDKVAVADQTYKQLMADQVAGKLIRTGSGNAPESVDQGLTAATRFGDVSFGKVTGTSLDINGNGDVSGTFQFGGAVTIKGALKAQGGLNVTSITATGTSTLAAVNATNISASGTLKVNGSSTLQAVSAKKVTATELDLNGNGDVSGNLVVHGKTTLEALQANGDVNVGGLLKVTGRATFSSSVVATGFNSTRGICSISNPDLKKGEAPDTSVFSHIDFYDGEAFSNYRTNRLGIVQLRVTTDGSSRMQLSCVKNEQNSEQTASLQVGFTTSGDPVSYAPITSDSATGDEIAVASFARKFGGSLWGLGCGLNTSPSGSEAEIFDSSNLNDWNQTGFYTVSLTNGQNTPTGSASMTGILLNMIRRWETGTSGLQVAPLGSSFYYRTKSGEVWNPWYILARDDQVVHRTGAESVAGIKNFSDNIQVSGHAVRQLYKNIDIAKGEAPTESQSLLLRLIGGTGSTIVANTFSELELCAHNSGDTYVRLWASNNSEGSTAREYIELRYNKAENRFSTRAPAPVTSSHEPFSSNASQINPFAR